MIDFYFSPTPNGWKIAIMLEECGLDYHTVLMNLPDGDQFEDQFLQINPNAKIPAIVDNDPDGQSISIFESGAILLYLSEKTNQFKGGSNQTDIDRDQWLFWQAANLGPMAGQLSHFVNYAPAKIDYALNRYQGEYERCLGVLNSRLSQQEYVLEEYSIVDMMIFPWAFIAKNLGVDLSGFPSVMRWRSEIKDRPAVRRAIDLHKDAQFTKTANAKTAPQLFNQSAKTF